MLKKLLKKLKEGGAGGFTLIELLVVMAIIAVLVTLIIVAIMSARLQQRNTQRRSFANNIKAAAEAYYSNAKYYPAQATAAAAYGGSTLSTALAPYWSGTWPAADPLGQGNRVVYCGGDTSPLGQGRYMLLVRPEANLTGEANPVIPACSQDNSKTPPAGWETFSN